MPKNLGTAVVQFRKKFWRKLSNSSGSQAVGRLGFHLLSMRCVQKDDTFHVTVTGSLILWMAVSRGDLDFLQQNWKNSLNPMVTSFYSPFSKTSFI
jgi:hypothetical protein